MIITVIGTGYVGLVTAAVFSHIGHTVYGLDIDKKKIADLKKDKIFFYEPGLKDLVLKNKKNKRLIFTTSYSQAIPKSDVIFICVGTPAKKNGDYNLEYVFKAAKSIAQNLKKYTVIAIKSTVPPSTNSQVKKIIDKYSKTEYDLASCPEFLREGSAVMDALNPSRVVLGVDSKKAKDRLIELHKPIKAPRVITDVKSAQLIKYAANAFLATKISFINSIARLCDKVKANIDDVEKGLGLDPRIGNKFLKAGLGYGGSCFPKDTWALIAFAKRLGYNFKFLKEVDNVNDGQVKYIFKKISKIFKDKVNNKVVAVLGLAFKPNTDDIRESRAIELCKLLIAKGLKVQAYDPKVSKNSSSTLAKVKLAINAYHAIDKADVLILTTEWPEFLKLDYEKIAKIMKQKYIVDARNFLNKKKLERLGFKYFGVGRN